MVSNKIKIRVRYAETDQMKIVYYANYFIYFEAGRSELLRSIGLPYSELEKFGYLLPVIEAYAKYHKSATYDDLIEVNTKLDEYNNVKIKLTYDVYNISTGELIAEGYTVHGFIDSNTMKPKRPPDIFIKAIKNNSTR